ncbi:MAG: glycoside hydrolase family 15 protein [Spirochaetaceae bacterium]|nr:glycoside hydrolase family 15 protein [Spirochaetaceae bacterium]
MALLIEDYALISDRLAAGLVGRDGSIDWLCFPRFDSDAVFAALLGSEDNGHWRLAPRGGGTCDSRAYRGDSMVLESEWHGPHGSVRVIDFMPERGEAPDVVRIVEGMTGHVEMRSELRLRFGYGDVIPWVRHLDGMLAAVAGPDSVWLASDVAHHGRDFASSADFTVEAGQRVSFVLTWNPSHQHRPRPVDPVAALEETERFWAEWAGRCTYTGPHRDAVVRSLVTLKALTYAPTGGIVAAPTTSLPEEIGGVRNWDYRFCWLRDAAFTLQALVKTGYTEEAVHWREWLLRAIAGSPGRLQILYGVAGERRVPETELPWLAGYEGSAPVRIGNGAVDQRQLDVYGEVMDTLWLARAYDLNPNEDAWAMQRGLMEWLEGNWREPDEGLWEVRGARQHFTHSKVLAWVAADRAVRTVELAAFDGPLERYRRLRDEIHADVCAQGYDSDRATFTQYYGSKELDAALLLIPQVGFLPPEDERVRGTLRAVRRDLGADGMVRRYDTAENVDGVAGDEGAFVACSFWLADALVLDGQVEEGRALFEHLLDLRNDVGLLAEEYDVQHGRQLGNFPQAYSHLALVNSALNLAGVTEANTGRSVSAEQADASSTS